jgi:hypothetical protein
MFKNIITKFMLVLAIAAIAIGALPTAAYAAPAFDDPQPGQGNDKEQRLAHRLEDAFARQQERYNRALEMQAKTGEMITRVQGLIDKANAQGLDASAVQSALDAFKAALPNAKTALDQVGASLNAHAGFDDKGKVTDLKTAAETVKSIRQGFASAHEALGGSGKALREAVRAFVEANKGTLKPANP